MPSQKRKLGDLGEQIAVDYLEQNNYKILERNYQKPWGEIDIIAKKDKSIIFIEVKARAAFQKHPLNYGFRPEESVRSLKQRRLIKTAQTYLLEKRYSSGASWQIDIIAVELDIQTRKANLKHIKNAIWQ